MSPDMAAPTVRAVTTDEVSELRETHGKWTPNLGGGRNESNVTALQDLMKHGADTFLVEWQGSKVPRGAEINGVPIGWTQNGMVSGTGGEALGTYERLVEYGGESGREQKMLIFANSSGT